MNNELTEVLSEKRELLSLLSILFSILTQNEVHNCLMNLLSHIVVHLKYMIENGMSLIDTNNLNVVWISV